MVQYKASVCFSSVGHPQVVGIGRHGSCMVMPSVDDWSPQKGQLRSFTFVHNISDCRCSQPPWHKPCEPNKALLLTSLDRKYTSSLKTVRTLSALHTRYTRHSTHEVPPRGSKLGRSDIATAFRIMKPERVRLVQSTVCCVESSPSGVLPLRHWGFRKRQAKLETGPKAKGRLESATSWNFAAC